MHTELIHQFEQTTQELLQILSSLSEKQLNTVPFEGSWTAGQVGEHLLKSYGVAEVLNGKVKPTERPIDEKVEEVKTLFLNFDIKMDSPEAIVPSEGLLEKAPMIASLETRIRQIQVVLEEADLSVTCLDFAIPEYGAFTRLEWIYFNVFHTQRHVHQLKNIVKELNRAKAGLAGK
ncbi:DinB family protein [Rapidithrix thailandica]|uniref:DinB family protein n=1 Tax=Rapidithrix thailandica TaxID=413964 RepID=A0AAW9SIG6_9BACT